MFLNIYYNFELFFKSINVFFNSFTIKKKLNNFKNIIMKRLMENLIDPCMIIIMYVKNKYIPKVKYT